MFDFSTTIIFYNFSYTLRRKNINRFRILSHFKYWYNRKLSICWKLLCEIDKTNIGNIMN